MGEDEREERSRGYMVVEQGCWHKEMCKSGTCEHSMKIVEKVLERRMRHMVKVEEMIP